MKRRNLVALAGMLVMLGSVLPVNAAESLETFDYETYADTYPDLKAAFGYDATALYNHYMLYGKAEGRVATFTEETQVAQPTQQPLQPQRHLTRFRHSIRLKCRTGLTHVHLWRA
mgnify:CR=1 FL=1